LRLMRKKILPWNFKLLDLLSCCHLLGNGAPV
jgi:hypothetical protein